MKIFASYFEHPIHKVSNKDGYFRKNLHPKSISFPKATQCWTSKIKDTRWAALLLCVGRQMDQFWLLHSRVVFVICWVSNLDFKRPLKL